MNLKELMETRTHEECARAYLEANEAIEITSQQNQNLLIEIDKCRKEVEAKNWECMGADREKYLLREIVNSQQEIIIAQHNQINKLLERL